MTALPDSGPSPQPKAEPVLVTQGVTKAFEGLVALADVSIDIRPGEVLGIIGPNGAGKTTLFNVVTGVLPVTDGHVLFGDHDITGVKTHRIAVGLQASMGSVWYDDAAVRKVEQIDLWTRPVERPAGARWDRVELDADVPADAEITLEVHPAEGKAEHSLLRPSVAGPR